MKKLTLSLAAIAAMGTFAVAGGDIAPVEPVVDTPVVAPSDAGFYVGGAYGYGNIDTHAVYSFNQLTLDDSFNTDSFMLQGGYKVNPYFAVEARYWFVGDESRKFALTKNGAPVAGFEGDANYESSAWGIYVKPMYPVTDSFDIYALLGYGSVNVDASYTAPAISTKTFSTSYDDGGFSWGLGASYDVTPHLSLFIDYVSIYDDSKTVAVSNMASGTFDTDLTVDSWNFGVTYKF